MQGVHTHICFASLLNAEAIHRLAGRSPSLLKVRMRLHHSHLPLTLFSAVVLSTLSVSSNATNGYFAHGYGVKAEAIAGVGVALAQDSLTIATNPAGLASVGNRVDAGLNLFAPDRSANISSNGAGLNGQHDANGKQYFFIPEFGYSRQIDARINAGVAVYGNGGMNTQYDQNPFAPLGAQGRAGVNLEQLFISPAVSYKLTPDHVIGAALNLAYQRFAAQGISPFGAASSSPNDLSNKGTDSSTGVGIRLGWTGQISPDLQLGVTWASKIQGRFDKYKGLFANQGEFDIPANYGLGLSYKARPDWTFGVDYQVIQYSEVAAVGNPLSRLTVNGKPLGSTDGPGFGWRDVSVYKLGVVHQWSPTLTLRAGYSHATQAVPADQAFFNVLAPGVVQDHFTAGFTWQADAKSEWSAFYAHAANKTVHGTGAIPASFGSGSANISLNENLLGISYGWKF